MPGVVVANAHIDRLAGLRAAAKRQIDPGGHLRVLTRGQHPDWPAEPAKVPNCSQSD
jgi:hypothetical protein